MSDHTLYELMNGEIVPDMGGENAWLVRFGEGEYDTVNKSGKNTLLLKREFGLTSVVSHGGIRVAFDLEEDNIFLTEEESGDDVRVPSEKHENVLWAVYDEDGPRLRDLFDELYEPTVREGLLDQLMPRFRNDVDEIEKMELGWIVNSDILVSWTGSNHPLNVDSTYVVNSGEAVEADEDKEAREIDFYMPDNRDVYLPNGTQTTLTDVEVRFLTTVGLLVETYQHDLYDDCLSEAIENSSVSAFTDSRSGLHHFHDTSKHTLSDLDVTEEAMDRLWYNEYDHTGVHELYVRRDEFEDAPIDVFEDASNDSPRKWREIQNTSERAPIPEEIRQDLTERYE